MQGPTMTFSLTIHQFTTIYWRKLLEFLHLPLINLHMLEKVATPEYLKELMMSFLGHMCILRNKIIPQQPLSVLSI